MNNLSEWALQAAIKGLLDKARCANVLEKGLIGMDRKPTCLKSYINRYNQTRRFLEKYTNDPRYTEMLQHNLEHTEQNIIRIVTGQKFLSRIDELSQCYNLGIMEIE